MKRIKKFEAYTNAQDFFFGENEKLGEKSFTYKNCLIVPIHVYLDRTPDTYYDFNIYVDSNPNKVITRQLLTVNQVKSFVDEYEHTFEAYVSGEDFFHGTEKEKSGDWCYRGYLISPNWHYLDVKTRQYNGYNDYDIIPKEGDDGESGTYLHHATIKEAEDFVDELIDQED